MQSKTSWFKKELLKQDLRSVGWISIVYLLGLLFVFPLSILMETEHQVFVVNYREDQGLFNYPFQDQTLLVCTMPILMAVFLFRYMQVRSYSDFIHSLPVKRTHLFIQHVVTGFILLIIPVILTGCSLQLVQSSIDVEAVFTTSDIWEWVGYISLVTSLLYMAGIFAGVMTAMSVVQAGLTYIMLLLPLGLFELIFANLEIYLKGFTTQFIFNFQVEDLSPLTKLTFANGNLSISIREVILYVVITVVLLGLALFFYQKRPLESTSQALAYPKLKPFFKYSVAACFTLLSGMYFWESQYSYSWLVFGYLAGSLLGYVIAEMLLKKTWRIFSLRALKGYCAFVVVFAVFVLLLKLDPFGYETRIPKTENIDKVYVASSSYSYMRPDSSSEEYLTKKTTIEAARKLHEQLLNNSVPEEGTTRSLFLAYKLKDGSKVLREYHFNEFTGINEFLKPIYESLEYKQYTERLLSTSNEEIHQLSFHTNQPSRVGLVVTEQSQINELLDRIREDLKQESYENMQAAPANSTSISAYLRDNKQMNIQISPQFTHTVDWLKKNGLYDQAFITVNDLESVKIMKAPENVIQWRYDQYFFDTVQSETADVFELTDKQDMKQLLNVSRSVYHFDTNYLVQFNYKGAGSDRTEVYGIKDSKVPEIVTEHFEKTE
ncbi:DUF6449 domain-containing protein [Halobacillus salinarum]|uniref:DUF6449 domain-containing protein n=1 Tax=Halobacillus salinarum TaxID=2932257 RepID=A0ABY4EK81_9BACI|nr:DUF6449 domain-containing protein [Halobacillus salinarum]UOQ44506.1 DUF6449 domain-containing protein [Halobacillus salinarum]